MNARRLLLCTAALLALALEATALEIVRLRDGTLVHGEIVEFDEATGFTLLRVDNGGLLTLRWNHLSAEEARRIKVSRGFTGEEVELYEVDVVQLLMKNGTFETGALVEGGPRDVFTLRRRSGVDEFPKRYVQSVESARAEGLAIFSPDELYLRILTEQGTPTTAAEHLDVAVTCEGARLYARAREHYRATRDTDPEYRPDLLASRLERVDIRIEEAAATALLDELRQRLYRRQFDTAEELAARFREEFPASRQLGDLADLQQQIAERRREFHAGRIISDYFSFLNAGLSRIARNDDMTLGAAMELVEEGLHEELVTKLSRSYGVDEEIIQELWDTRRGGSLRSSSYGSGTFILGPDKALKWKLGRHGADEDEEDADDLDPEDEDLESRIEEVLRRRREQAQSRQSSARANRGLESVGLSPDEWWAATPRDDRQRWLSAYFAEFSGQLDIERAKPVPCRTCRADGFVEIINDRNEVERVTCPTGKGLRYERLVSFR